MHVHNVREAAQPVQHAQSDPPLEPGLEDTRNNTISDSKMTSFVAASTP
jgi:hypothetical protein